jgi:hypothetical protein
VWVNRFADQVFKASAIKLDDQTRINLALFSSNRWLSIRLELLGGECTIQH